MTSKHKKQSQKHFKQFNEAIVVLTQPQHAMHSKEDSPNCRSVIFRYVIFWKS